MIPALTEKQQVEQHRFMVQRTLEQMFDVGTVGTQPVAVAVNHWYESLPPSQQAALVHEEPLYVALEIIGRFEEGSRFQAGDAWHRYLEITQRASDEWLEMNPQIFNRVRSRFDLSYPSSDHTGRTNSNPP